MKRYKFKAKLVKDDERSGYKKGKKIPIWGFYYNPNNKKIILVSDFGRLAFPEDNIEVEVTC